MMPIQTQHQAPWPGEERLALAALLAGPLTQALSRPLFISLITRWLSAGSPLPSALTGVGEERQREQEEAAGSAAF